MRHKSTYLTLAAGGVALCIAAAGYHVYALGFILVASITLLSGAESGGPGAKTALTAALGAVGLFVYVVKFGVSPSGPTGDVLAALETVSEAIHLEIFAFLGGLYLVVNTFAYSGLIGDMAWNIVKRANGRLDVVLVSIMLLTCVLSGFFDGATITTVMGIITLTILLSSGMPEKSIISVLILLVVATNIGGVWFVLGEPTNILAASKLSLSPLWFLQYALPFSIPAAILCAVFAWRIARKYPKVRSDRPEMEVLLEGIALRRTHAGAASLGDTIVAWGNAELKKIREMRRIIDTEGLPDFEAALKAGIEPETVYHALAINLNSDQLARGLVDYYQYRTERDPMADIILGDLLQHLKDEYASRTRSRVLVIASGIVLITLLGLHAFFPFIPTWASTIVAGALAIAAVQRNARLYILRQSWHNLTEAFFLLAIFATISEINLSGAFTRIGGFVLNLGSPVVTSGALLAASAFLSAVADNIAVIDVFTNLIAKHPDWNFFALASVVGTALGGFATPIASVQAIIMGTIMRKMTHVGFGTWLKSSLPAFIILLVVSLGMLWGMYEAGYIPRLPLPGSAT